MTTETWYWIVFTIIISVMLAIDLWVTDHRHGKLGIKSALIWSGIWIGVALLFNVSIYFKFPNGHEKALEFLTGYLIEKSLSVDNLFVFIMIFTVMGVEEKNQPHILKWGILGAVVFRIVFILGGVALIQAFDFVVYIFGAILLYTAYKMAFMHERKIEPDKNILIRIASKIIPVKTDNSDGRFFIKQEGKIFATSYFLTLLLIESTDIVFAIDSIPAILAITRDPFIVITSNIFAILGLRALYFALAGVMGLFRYLKYGIALLLFYVGIKLLISHFYHIPTLISLGIIAIVLTASILASIFIKKDKEIIG
ncbi:MAG: TerC family protein [Bacteroidetes bacterium]|nr:TerC family protein [Bacteroidota bacterium]MBU2585344.1 TerC family protein [Bacteroidota bacterium]